MRRIRWISVLVLAGALGCQWILGIDDDDARFHASSDASNDASSGDDADLRESGGSVTAEPSAAADASCVLAAGARELWVDSAREDAPEVGTASCPFRTITKALTAARASAVRGMVIRLAAGTYGPEETVPLVVRGVSLRGAGSSRTFIRGSQPYDHSGEGGQFGDAALPATMIVGDVTETTVISGVTVVPSAGAAAEMHYGIVCDRGSSPDARTAPAVAANTILDDVVLGPGYEVGAVVTNSSSPAPTGCNVQATRSTFVGNAIGVWALGCGRMGAGAGVSVRVGDGTEAGANVFRDNRKEYVGDPNGGRGVLVWDCVHTFEVRRNVFEGNDRGIQIEQNEIDGANVVSRNLFRAQRYYGIYLVRRADLRALEDNTFEGTVRAGPNAPAMFTRLDQLGAGVRLFQPLVEPGEPAGTSIKRARGNRFVNNEIGVLVQAAVDAKIAPSDFGRQDDPGNNEFSCNASRQPSFERGGDVVISSPTPTPEPIRFRGNQWDHVPPSSGADGGAPANGIDLWYSKTLDVEVHDATPATGTCAPGFVR